MLGKIIFKCKFCWGGVPQCREIYEIVSLPDYSQRQQLSPMHLLPLQNLRRPPPLPTETPAT